MNFISAFVGIMEILLVLAAILLHKATQRNQPAPKTENMVNGRAPALCAGAEPVYIFQYRLCDLEAATDHFSDENKLGKGGFGVVYKGTIDGQIVAIKSLHGSSVQLLGDIAREVSLISSLNNDNLVKLLGFCSEAGHFDLVYEYIPNGDLLGLLDDREKRKALNWDKRFKIIKGIARGLYYLHHNSENVVVHRDLKPENILLDEHYNPKIADFGLSRIFDATGSHKRTRVLAGTLGYIAPELYFQQQYSTRSDVYCYGLLVLEILAGCTIRRYAGANQESLSHVMWKQWKNKRPLAEMIDPTLRQNCPRDPITRCYLIGLLCVQHYHTERPDMETVLNLLSTTIDIYSSVETAPSFPGYFREPSGPQYFGNNITVQPKARSPRDMSLISTRFTYSSGPRDASTLTIQSTSSAFVPVPDPIKDIVVESYTLYYLQQITQYFSWKLGNEMYKGYLFGQTLVVEKYTSERAISNLAMTAAERKKKFPLLSVLRRNVKSNILPLKHNNIVQIVGYCLEVERTLFIMYKCPAHGSLYDYLHGSVLYRKHFPEWALRVNMINGIAKGICYIHHGLQERNFIHGDIKSSNIFLDDLWNARLCGFHCSTSLHNRPDQHLQSTRPQGHNAPDVIMGNDISRKSDVFSYGMVMLEILVNNKEIWNMIPQVWNHWESGRMVELLHPALQHCCPDLQEPLRYFHIALLCIQPEPNDRPEMSRVVQMLNSSDTLPMPIR